MEKILHTTHVQSTGHEFRITWKFIPPEISWHERFYESLISVLKSCLKKILFQRHITINKLNTLLTETEARVNNRQSTCQVERINEPHSHRYGRKIRTFPIYSEELTDCSSKPLQHQPLKERKVIQNKILREMAKELKRRIFNIYCEKYSKAHSDEIQAKY